MFDQLAVGRRKRKPRPRVVGIDDWAIARELSIDQRTVRRFATGGIPRTCRHAIAAWHVRQAMEILNAMFAWSTEAGYPR
ncbi:hypothetical protein CTP10_R72000 (plasmid) [Cupriavidus sp. P-10]|uniref:hypothetical protein n=1 Tax=Cupriavidus sp. P-10 TaxID=2027911 RepID=UPI000EBF9626|nr:hypothetical protein CTP10_R72000 [Cupriavidus sp. P-10]